MKKTIQTCTLLLSLILLSSCTKIILFSYGVRNPKVEDKKSILNYLESNNLSIENNYCLKDTSSLYKFYQSNIGSPEIRFYDKNGYLMLYRDDKKCNGQNDSLISFLDPKNIIKIDSSNNIINYLKEIKTLDGLEIKTEDFKHFDYYLIMYWAKWAGKVNKTKMSDWEDSIKKKNDFKIKTIKVTTDYMNFWELDKKDMAKVYSRKTKLKNKNK